MHESARHKAASGLEPGAQASKKTRSRFDRIPGFAARFYDRGAQFPAIREYYTTIAREIVERMHRGRLLDVGTGPGRLLLEIARLNRDIELFGLDISKAMLRVARENLKGVPVQLIRADIAQPGYPDSYFDMVTCTGSLYLWHDPIGGLAQVHRILKPGSMACMYESHREFDAEELRRGLEANLQRAGWLFRFAAPRALRKQLSMTFSIPELKRLILDSPFAGNFRIEKVTISRLPVWLRITLWKD